MLVPWHESHGFGDRPVTAAAASAAALNFRERLLSALIRGIAEWRRDNVGNLESDTSLRGLVWHAPSGSPGSSHRR
jgi:hypothetical protein